jgi:retron-type reverse transcriptase
MPSGPDCGQSTYPEAGTPQGGVISPLLANVYLHEVVQSVYRLGASP